MARLGPKERNSLSGPFRAISGRVGTNQGRQDVLPRTGHWPDLHCMLDVEAGDLLVCRNAPRPLEGSGADTDARHSLSGTRSGVCNGIFVSVAALSV